MAEPRLQVVLQDRRSRLYLAGRDKWTRNISEAFDFKALERARHFVHSEPMPYVRIVPRFTRAEISEAA